MMNNSGHPGNLAQYSTHYSSARTMADTFYFRRDGGGPMRGYGLDLNGDRRFSSREDGILALDFNRDGRLNDSEVASSNQLFKAMGGNFDLDGNGWVSGNEMLYGSWLRWAGSSMDTDRNGSLDTNELSRAGAMVWHDRNGDGRIQNELSSVWAMGPQHARLENFDTRGPAALLSRRDLLNSSPNA